MSTEMKDYHGGMGFKSTAKDPFPKEVKHIEFPEGKDPGVDRYPDTVKDSVKRQDSAVESLRKRGKPESKLY